MRDFSVYLTCNFVKRKDDEYRRRLSPLFFILREIVGKRNSYPQVYPQGNFCPPRGWLSFIKKGKGDWGKGWITIIVHASRPSYFNDCRSSVRWKTFRKNLSQVYRGTDFYSTVHPIQSFPHLILRGCSQLLASDSNIGGDWVHKALICVLSFCILHTQKIYASIAVDSVNLHQAPFDMPNE